MIRPKHVLITGAGPTGLVAAIELTRREIPVTIIDKKTAPSPQSRAVGINARTLELLEACSVTDRLIHSGTMIRRAVLFDKGRIFLDLDLTRVAHRRYNFILALPQNETEAILLDRLAEMGVTPRLDTELTGFTVTSDGVEATVQANGQSEVIHADLLFAADGAHSLVRKHLNIPFEGERYPEVWQLYDVTLSQPPGPGEMNTYLGDNGAMLFTVQIGGDRYRMMENVEEPDFGAQTHFPKACRIVETHWQSDFHLSRRLVARYAEPPVFLGGDAAHIHPPAGGRGMNLGIEDAWEFARRAATGGLESYSADRRAVGAGVVRQTDGFLRAMTLKNPVARVLRNVAARTLGRIPVMQRTQLSAMSGLDAKRTPPDA